MRSVLFLSYYFPPVGGAGAQRPAAFVRYLPRSGYQPIVVTGPGPAHSRWTPQDETLLAKLPEGTQVRRVPGPVPSDTGFVRERVGRYLGLRTGWDRWWIDGATTCAADLGSETDLVYAWMSPFSSAVVASRIAKKLRRPWIADLGDPWALDEMMVYPTRAHRRLAIRQMRDGLQSAAAIVMSTQEAVFRVREAFPEFEDKPIVAIPNGFDSDDFGGPAPDRDPNVFRIVHTGYFHTQLGLRHRNAAPMRRLLGGAVPGVDFLTRSHYFLLEAVDRLLQEDPSLERRLEIHLAGVLSEVDRELAEGSPVTRLHGYLSHEKTLELLRTADLLFLPMQDLRAGVRATIVPGKTYEYLATGRPILAAVPDGDARDLLAETGTGLICRPGDVDGMVRILRDQLERFRLGLPPPEMRHDLVSRYDYRHLTRALTEVFDEVDGPHGQVVGSVRRPVAPAGR